MNSVVSSRCAPGRCPAMASPVLPPLPVLDLFLAQAGDSYAGTAFRKYSSNAIWDWRHVNTEGLKLDSLFGLHISWWQGKQLEMAYSTYLWLKSQMQDMLKFCLQVLWPCLHTCTCITPCAFIFPHWLAMLFQAESHLLVLFPHISFSRLCSYSWWYKTNKNLLWLFWIVVLNCSWWISKRAFLLFDLRNIQEKGNRKNNACMPLLGYADLV